MKIEPNIIDENIEKEGHYTDTAINTLQERLDTINFQFERINMQLKENDVSVSVEDKAKLFVEKSKLEDERAEIEHRIAALKEQKKEEESELESAEAFKGSLDENEEELFSARSIGKATAPKVSTTDKKEARKVEEDIIKNDKQINDEFGKEANDMLSKMEDLFR